MDETTAASITASLGFITDQAIKLTIQGTTSVLGVSFYRVANTGGSFGFFQGYNAAFIPIAFIALAVMWWYRSHLGAWATALILSGGMSNLIDRIIHGHVVDYVDLGFWPVFNVADAMIVVGVAIVFINEWRMTDEAVEETNTDDVKAE